MMGPNFRKRLELAGAVTAGAVAGIVALQMIARGPEHKARMDAILGSREDWDRWENDAPFEGRR